MDNIRLILLFAFAFICLLLYQAWMTDYGSPQVVAPQQTGEVVPAATESAGVPTASVAPGVTASGNQAVPATIGVTAVGGKIVRVETDLLKVEISTLGGTLQRVRLLDYQVSPETPELKFQLLSPMMPNLFIAQSGMIGSEEGKAPTHEAEYQIEQSEYSLSEDQDTIDVAMAWAGSDGLKVTKHFIFNRGSYLIDVTHEVDNQSAEPWAARDYAQLQRTEPTDQSRLTTYTYTGGVYYNPEAKYEKVDFDEMAEKGLNVDSTDGWLAMIQHYFLGAWIPPKTQMEHYYTNSLPGPKYLIGSYSPSVTVAPGSSHSFSKQLFVGPKLQDHLVTVAPGLELTVDYGWLTVIAQPIFWLLKKIHSWVGNWGWSIILLTIMIKALFFKLSETSYKSMANMRKLTPRLQAMKDRYGDDKQRLNQAMMEMYKKEKVNPLGGCLPILVQIPVFIALYWVLLESVEMRQAPFMLWIDNLSAKDPYFVLPLIMGVSMFVQQKLNPAPPDPMQAKIMMSLPFVFTIFFAFFPSGLVLYWVVNNLISIAQQYYITRKIEQAG
ncbi:MAG: membrane protein insertase YidC [endosymbiont of Seepiophila jonesi]|uniref:Membrane protein insertase YidC n=1 Tax=endosymbiont of Lamellibrachia luymesi TaxID=2200907 RepID=A0A370DZW3_9GAMM|nr:MAG: membrane protein insertase YidC [endosymbiont of Lamellibrachia luymesi]RDH91177.1 MAG: membrane protein insertase YidC [endosymbiont of Seepiophila jonesi]